MQHVALAALKLRRRQSRSKFVCRTTHCNATDLHEVGRMVLRMGKHAKRNVKNHLDK